MAELNDLKVNGNLTVSGGGSFTENVTAPNINDLINNLKEKALSGSSSGITEYPSKAGIYRVTGANIGFPFSTYNYGTLIIFFSGYVTHIFIDSTSEKIWYAIGSDSVKCPSTWHELPNLDNDLIGRHNVVYALDPGSTSSILTHLGITPNDTVGTVYGKLKYNSSTMGVFYIYCGHSQSTFRDSLPEKTGAIVEFIKFNNRGIIKCTHYNTGKSYSAGYSDGMTAWVPL